MRVFNKRHLVLLLAGALCTLGFAPFGIFPIPVLALAVLFALLHRAESRREAGWLGFVFGLGLFSVGVSWIYVALHDYGDMPMSLAAPATLLFAAFLALFPVLAAYMQACIPVGKNIRLVLVMPACWVLIEWLRGMIFTGFPWLTLGYAHSGSPLAGYAAMLGVYGVSLVAAISAGLLVIVLRARWNRLGKVAVITLLAVWSCGAVLRGITWTVPNGEPFSVALLQGNIAQRLKFDDSALVGTLETYRRLVLDSDARLIVLPETAMPLLRGELPSNLISQLRDHAKQNDGDVVIGSFDRDQGGFYNSVFTLGASEEQHYRKHHLVVFGEFIPLRPLLG